MSEKDIESIRTAAYYIWEKEGCPEGKDEEIWLKACAQMAGLTKAKKPAAKKAVAKKVAQKAIIAKPVVKAPVKVVAKPVAKIVAKPVVKATVKPVVKMAPKAAVKQPAKAATFAVPAKKAKINPVPVKTAATKIITPLYGSIKK